MADAPVENHLPLLELPEIVIASIVESIDLVNVLKISMLSKKAARLMKHARVQIAAIDVQVGFKEFLIEFSRSSRPSEYIHWQISRQPATGTQLLPYSIVVDEHPFDCVHFKCTGRNLETLFVPERRLQGFMSVLKHVLCVFQSTVGTMQLISSGFEEHTVWNALSACEHARVHGSLTRVGLTEFITRCTFTQSILLHGEFPDLADHFDRLTTGLDSISLHSAPWFTYDHLRRANCRFLIVFTASVFSSEFHDYIEEWKSGSDRRLERLRITPFNRAYKKDDIWPGPWISITGGPPPDPEVVVDRGAYRCDVRRESDGARMEVTVRYDHVVLLCTYS